MIRFSFKTQRITMHSSKRQAFSGPPVAHKQHKQFTRALLDHPYAHTQPTL
jgi:hypothetical protein